MAPPPNVTAIASPCSTGVPIQLPAPLQGKVRYLVGLDTQFGAVYSVPIETVLLTKGAEVLVDYLYRQRHKEHKKSIRGFFCPSLAHGVPCRNNERCVHLHVTPEGYATRQRWLRPVRKVIQSREPFAGRDGTCETPSTPLSSTSSTQYEFPDPLPLHLRIPMREELARKGHVAHNPYAIPFPSPVNRKAM